MQSLDTKPDMADMLLQNLLTEGGPLLDQHHIVPILKAIRLLLQPTVLILTELPQLTVLLQRTDLLQLSVLIPTVLLRPTVLLQLSELLQLTVHSQAGE